MPPAGKDEALAAGYLFLLQRLLEHLRYRTDRGYADAAALIADFQAKVAAQAEAGQVDGHMLALLGGALHQSKIPASPELAAASAKHALDQNESGPLPTDISAVFAGILEACGSDPFMIVGSLIESGHAMPAETRGTLAGALALADIPEARAAAVLFLLDPDLSVRRAVAGALAQVAASLTPIEVRRLIAMRNWRPRMSVLKWTPSSARREALGSIARNGRRAASRQFSPPASMALRRKVFCWCRRPAGRSGSRRS